ncbi:MAG: glycosyltransferase [Bacteroidales bacterium]|nr:glycosyltransferase [Bacteroidales bacterium]
MDKELSFSIIVPVYRRNDELTELLDSLTAQSDKDFEILILEAPSDADATELCKTYEQKLNIVHRIDNGSRSARRNLGIEMSHGNYCLLFDSDVILPTHYIATVRKALQTHYVDCFGGPDSADNSFNTTQKAVNYAMTSIMTTGGIRGGTKKVNSFLPRAFNMGFSKEAYQKVGGYREMIGEDVDLSMRIREAGFSIQLIPEAVVVHKRRITLTRFFRQVYTFGKARVLLTKLHPGSLKIMHLLPTAFTLGTCFLVVCAIVWRWWCILPLVLFALLTFTESLIRNKSLAVAALSIITSFTQLFGYGTGLLDELITKRASQTAAEQLYRQ